MSTTVLAPAVFAEDDATIRLSTPDDQDTPIRVRIDDPDHRTVLSLHLSVEAATRLHAVLAVALAEVTR